MTPEKILEHKGDLRAHPFAELLAEIMHAKLSGSLRLSDREKKTVIYFSEGAVVYAVSNSRTHRLFNCLLQRGLIEQSALAEIVDFTNDIELSAELLSRKIVTKAELDAAVVSQIESLLIDTLVWPEGSWTFDPLARLRQDLKYDVDVFSLLTDYARCIPSQSVSTRFKSVHEAFSLVPERLARVPLQAHESHVLGEFKRRPMTIEQAREICAIPESALFQALYVLWLGGFLARCDWNSAFSRSKVDEIRSAKVSLVKTARRPVAGEPGSSVAPASEPAADASQPAEKFPENTLTLEEYLARMASAATSYDMLGVAADARLSEIKNAYFGLAKLFHPDRFHREEPAVRRRIQIAFTELAHGYETLKNTESRETYDYKVRKELEKREKRKAEGLDEAPDLQDRKAEHGLENFEQALSLMAEDEYAAATPFLARAVHYSPQNALYHAYYGKALAADDKFRHQAESELQTAVRLDPKNGKIRIMLVEFFIELNMKKRAEGELKRFLELVPNNTEASRLLDGLRV